MMVSDMKQQIKLHIVMLKLRALGIFGRNFEKEKVLRESGLYKNYGRRTGI